MGLEQPLGLAERIFGFVSDHGEKSHPFRARVRFEPLWGPAVAQAKPANHVSLGPLTSPESRAKCRPLYLQGNAGKSASYSDAQPKLRGRKFYWKQRYGEGQLWPFHLRGERRPDDPAAAQCPPPIEALPAGTTFTTRIHFENLSAAELGVLLYALVGFSDSHCIHLGKGKPRGLGVCGVKAKVTWFHPKDRYASLTEPPPSKTMTPQEFADARAAFAKWCEERAKPFAELDHIKDFEKLHTWPEADSVRYYPVNWAQYAWVPLPNKNPGDPLAADRPFAMKPAHELEPQPVYR
jgi:CRISPR-associated protein (TIGR03986 family)